MQRVYTIGAKVESCLGGIWNFWGPEGDQRVKSLEENEEMVWRCRVATSKAAADQDDSFQNQVTTSYILCQSYKTGFLLIAEFNKRHSRLVAAPE